jgi:hypothetical protein
MQKWWQNQHLPIGEKKKDTVSITRYVKKSVTYMQKSLAFFFAEVQVSITQDKADGYEEWVRVEWIRKQDSTLPEKKLLLPEPLRPTMQAYNNVKRKASESKVWHSKGPR